MCGIAGISGGSGDRRPKRGFALPYDQRVRHHRAPLVEDTCSRKAVAARGLLDPDLVELWCRAVLL